LCSNLANSDVYVYADFLKPGYHQLLIFDPLLERAYCKDFMVNINLREDLFPEFPIIDGIKIKERVKNVFEQWKEDRYEDVIKAYQIDRNESENFCIARLVKDEADQNKCFEILLDNFEINKVYHKHL